MPNGPVKIAEGWIRMDDFGKECCTNGNGPVCGKPAHCPFCLAASWQSAIEKAPGCTHLLTEFGVELLGQIKGSMSNAEVAAVLVENLLRGHLETGESMGKLRKSLSHYGWVIIEPAIAIEMAKA